MTFIIILQSERWPHFTLDTLVTQTFGGPYSR